MSKRCFCYDKTQGFEASKRLCRYLVKIRCAGSYLHRRRRRREVSLVFTFGKFNERGHICFLIWSRSLLAGGLIRFKRRAPTREDWFSLAHENLIRPFIWRTAADLLLTASAARPSLWISAEVGKEHRCSQRRSFTGDEVLALSHTHIDLSGDSLG